MTNHRLTRVLAALGAAVLVLAAHSTAAAADPASWRWGALHSTDGLASARGKVVAGQSGLAVTGYLDDDRGKGCSWVVLRYQSASNGRWRTFGIYNCVPGTGSFRKGVGGVLQIRAQVCRGTSKRPVGRCSRWRTIYTQGG
ncbi:hypothetical protein ACFFV7_20985 [Nonomuraea spiralis]|uniref:Secreted protein n=1 Tax=Nonomuraea spiralis TaxID=46182 RepID=A0ABV5IGL6_9ACTN|nr:hypothetical protein [Nonomuraea spiralis]GGS98464.1 hypothetical protein GCM10010176_048040 [Nonomuraea spiralis]